MNNEFYLSKKKRINNKKEIFLRVEPLSSYQRTGWLGYPIEGYIFIYFLIISFIGSIS